MNFLRRLYAALRAPRCFACARIIHDKSYGEYCSFECRDLDEMRQIFSP